MISFLTPTHNHEKYIEKCIKSVLGQKYPDIEQIIVDDGSTDATGKIAEEYASDIVRYYWQENKGISRLAETYNFALSRARGEIIAVLEGDDYATDIRALCHNIAFSRPDVVLSWGVTTRMRDDLELGRVPDNPQDYIDIEKNAMIVAMLKGCHVSANTVAVRKSALEAIGGFHQGAYYVDYPTWLRLLPLGNFHFTNQVLSIWGVHSDSFSSVLGSSARPDRDAITAYDSFPPGIQSLISRNALTKYWKNVIFMDRLNQTYRLIRRGNVYLGAKRLIEAAGVMVSS